jgi:hypothetical protein
MALATTGSMAAAWFLLISGRKPGTFWPGAREVEVLFVCGSTGREKGKLAG